MRKRMSLWSVISAEQLFRALYDGDLSFVKYDRNILYVRDCPRESPNYVQTHLIMSALL